MARRLADHLGPESREGGIMRFVKIIVVCLMLCALPIAAQEEAVEEVDGGVVIDVVDLEAFLDGIIEGRMESYHVPGITISVVHNGEMIFAKGYGYGDLETRRAVDPAVTLFRPGSISKTFTWTAVMQLVEQGKLDLNADVRTYLKDVEIPDTFSEPITMLDLMSHSPGWEDSGLGHLFGNKADAVPDFREYMKTHQPERVRPPGKVSAYSNYGTALAGLIISNISGMVFEDYIDQNILGPLGMNDSTFRETWTNIDVDPMPERLVKNRSNGYVWKNGGFEAQPMEYIHQVGAAGSMSVTATDMARWMLMHLGEGTYDGVQILAPETAQLMHERHFVHDEAMPGMAHGFLEYRVPGYRAWGHAGGTSFFVSQMVMVPELGFGFFASSNARDGANVIYDLHNLIVPRYFPAPGYPEVVEPPADFAERGKKYAGDYVTTRRSYTKIEKLGILMGGMKVSITDDGYLVTSGGGNAQKWVEIAPDTFRQVDGHGILKFVVDDRGKVVRFLVDQPYFVMEPAGLYEKSSTVIVISVLVLLCCLGVLIAAWYRRKQTIEQSSGERFASLVLIITALTWLVFFAVFAVGLSGMAGAMYDFPTPAVFWSLVIALIGVGLTVLSVVLLYPVWKKGSWSIGRRLRHTFVVLMLIDLLLMLNSYNLIGFKYF
jgi:CubicO group peptidase (beta-lactamase class C family)